MSKISPVCMMDYNTFDKGWLLGEGKMVEFTLRYPGLDKRSFYATGCLVILDRENLHIKRPAAFMLQVRRIIRDEFKKDLNRCLELLGLDSGTKIYLGQIGLKMSSENGFTF